MPTVNKVTKSKASDLKMQLTSEQRVFVVQTFCVTSSYLELKGAICRLSSENFQRKTHQKDPKHERD